MNTIVEKIKQFSNSYKKEVEQKHNSDLTSYKILVNELPKEIKAHISELGEDIRVKGSIGAGVNTYYPWIGILI
jgi:hypothetical protein